MLLLMKITTCRHNAAKVIECRMLVLLFTLVLFDKWQATSSDKIQQGIMVQTRRANLHQHFLLPGL